MNSSTNEKALSEFLQEVVAGDLLHEKAARVANELPSHELQEEAVNLFRDDERLMKLVVRELTIKGREAGFSLPQVPHGRIGKAFHSMEKFAAWDILGDVEEWMSVKVPPYRYVHRVFSWACTAFSVETVLAVLISIVMVYGIGLGLWKGTEWVWHHFQSSPRQAVSRGPATSTPLDSGLQSAGMTSTAVPFQIMNPTYVDGNKLELHWPDLGAGYTYRIFFQCDPTAAYPPPSQVSDVAITGTAARVNMVYDEVCLAPQIKVYAFLPTGGAGPVSNPVTFRLSPVNRQSSVEPIAMEPAQQTAANQSGGQPGQRPTRKAAKGVPITEHLSPPSRLAEVPVSRPTGQPPVAAAVSSAPKPSKLNVFAHALLKNADGAITSVIPIAPVGEGVVAVKNAAVAANDEIPSSPPLQKGGVREDLPPAVVNLRGERVGRSVRMTWDSPGTDYRYNVYVAYNGDHPIFDTGNDTPLNGPVLTWTPPSDGVQVFVLYIKAVDAQGHEGPASNRIIADLR